MKWPFKKKELDIQFIDKTRRAYNIHPVVPAAQVVPFFRKEQMNECNQYRFSVCPGMVDYTQYGYIIPAWDDIHIMANKAGIVAKVGGPRGTAFEQPRPMDASIGRGIFTPHDIPLNIIHITNPWNILTNKDISAMLMPAFYHSPFLDDIYIYPGIVDYGKNFSAMNLICAPRRECKLTIPAGTPLMQVIPFESNKIRAGYGPASLEQKDIIESFYSTSKQFYRKYISRNKHTRIQPDDSSTSIT